LLTRTRGTAIVNNLFDSYKPVHEVDSHANDHGSLVSSETGVSNSYGLNNAQERGILFIGPAVEVYEGMVIGKNALDSDIEINVCKTKKLTNMRSSGNDDAIILTPPKEITLDFALEYIGPDELVEVTPQSIRLRKKKPNRQKKGVGYNLQNDGESFEEIAKKLGISVAGAKRLEVVALAKVEYLHDLDEKDRGEIIATAVEDYIKYLSKSGELSKEEVGLMKQHPEIVANLDGFREHLHKYIRNAMKADGKEFYPGAGDDE
jgi:hypothetical protein